jgi:hypothetical protein
MHHVIRTLAAIRFALSTRRDLLLEILALHHQLAVRARGNRRFRLSDRLLWLILRRVWPRWRDALVLVQPATVDRWHRARFVRRWWRPSRRPGRPRIDSTCRDLIERLAGENRLWGAPRIHGELLKLGLVVSERTVSRYLQERPNRPSQTWRTFIVNHPGQLECDSQMLLSDVSGDDLVDASLSMCRPISSERLPASTQCALLAGRVSVRRTGFGLPCTQNHLRDATVVRRSAGRAPPGIRFFEMDATAARGITRREGRSDAPDCANGNRDERETIARRQWRSVRASSDGCGLHLVLRWTLCVAHSRNIGEAQFVPRAV